MIKLPLIIEPSELASALDNKQLIILDLRDPSSYAKAHVPNAISFSLSEVINSTPPIGGMLPSDEKMSQALSRIAFANDKHIIAVDDNGGPQAARLLWTLEAFGITGASFLNGGMTAWLAEIGAVDDTAEAPLATEYRAKLQGNNSTDRDYLLQQQNNENIQLLDARTLGEFNGDDLRSARGGHIPGAIHFEWSQIKGPDMKFKALSDIQPLLDAAGFKKDKETIAYCQTHMRSSVVCLILKALGYSNVKGYPGAWSDWGNQGDTPIE